MREENDAGDENEDRNENKEEGPRFVLVDFVIEYQRVQETVKMSMTSLGLRLQERVTDPLAV